MATSIQKEFKVKNGMVVRNTATFISSDGIVTTSTDVVASLPTLNLNFLNGLLDPRIAFTRASAATYVNKNGYIQYVGNDTPRFDYSSTSTGTCLGLLIEEQRTNLHTYSSAFASNWSNNGNARMTRSAVTAPDGGLADIMTNTPNVGSYIFGTAVNLTSSTVYTRSMYGKGLGGNNLLIMEGYDSAAATTRTAQFDVSTGTVVYVGTGTGSIVDAGNGWWRCSWTFTSSTGTTDNSRVLYVGGYGTSPLTVPIAIWGSQLEQGSFATSYIPTGSSTVTRSVDLAVMNGKNFQSWFNMNQGTLYAEADSISSGVDTTNVYRWVVSLSTGNGQKIGFYKIYLSSGFLPKIADDGYTSRFEPLLGLISTSTVFKTALSYSSGNQFAALNYVNTASGTTTLTPRVIDNLRIGNGDACWCGHIRKIAYYPQQLPNSQVQTLTSSTSFTNTNFAGVSSPATHTGTTSNFTIKQGIIVPNNLEVPDVDKLYITNLTRPSQQPSLNLNFLKDTLDPRVAFTRASGATVVGPNGYVQYVGNDTPRFDYSSTSTGTCLGLLIEEQRTNLLPYSSSIGGTNWNTRAGATSKLNAGISPDGTSNATLVTQTSGDGYVWQYYTFLPSTSYTFSFYAKKASGSPTISYQIWTGLVGYSSNGSVALGDAYTRYTLSFTTTATVTSGDLGFYIQNGSALAWGAQLEVGSFATSYIPTGSSTVTRATEYAGISGQNLYSWFNPKQGTIYTESDSITTATQTGAIFDISDVYDSSRMSIYRQSDKQPVAQYYVPSPVSNTQIGLGAIWTDLSVRKLGTSYSANNFYIASNAVNSGTITSGIVPGNITKASVGSFTSGINPTNGHIRRIVYYPEQLANTLTQAITAI